MLRQRRGAARKAAYETLAFEQPALLKVGEVDLTAMPAFGALGNKCFNSEQGEYEYEVCPFRKASQKKRDGGRSFSLGTTWRWEHMPSHIHAAKCVDRHVDCPKWAEGGKAACLKWQPGLLGRVG